MAKAQRPKRSAPKRRETIAAPDGEPTDTPGVTSGQKGPDVTPETIEATSDQKAEATAVAAEAVRKAAEGQKPRRVQGIACLGSHPQTVLAAPWDDPNWLIYACSPHNLIIQAKEGRSAEYRWLLGGNRPDGGRFRVDQWFETHLPLADETRHYGYLRSLERLPVVWMRDTEGLAMIKGARRYPQEDLEMHFSNFFWTSSISLMMAKAIDDCLCGQTWRYMTPLPVDIAMMAGASPEEAKGITSLDDIAKMVVNKFQGGKKEKFKNWMMACLQLYGTFGATPPIPNLGIWGVMQASKNEYSEQRPGIQFMIQAANKVGLNVIAPRESKLFEPQKAKW